MRLKEIAHKHITYAMSPDLNADLRTPLSLRYSPRLVLRSLSLKGGSVLLRNASGATNFLVQNLWKTYQNAIGLVVFDIVLLIRDFLLRVAPVLSRPAVADWEIASGDPRIQSGNRIVAHPNRIGKPNRSGRARHATDQFCRVVRPRSSARVGNEYIRLSVLGGVWRRSFRSAGPGLFETPDGARRAHTDPARFRYTLCTAHTDRMIFPCWHSFYRFSGPRSPPVVDKLDPDGSHVSRPLAGPVSPGGSWRSAGSLLRHA